MIGYVLRNSCHSNRLTSRMVPPSASSPNAVNRTSAGSSQVPQKEFFPVAVHRALGSVACKQIMHKDI